MGSPTQAIRWLGLRPDFTRISHGEGGKSGLVSPKVTLMADFGTTCPNLGPLNSSKLRNFSESELVPRLLQPTGMTVLSVFSDSSQVRFPGGSQPMPRGTAGIEKRARVENSGGISYARFSFVSGASLRHVVDTRMGLGAVPEPV